MKMLSTMAVGLIYMHTRAAADDAAVDGAVKAADDLFARGSVGAAQQKYEELLRSRPGSAEITERLSYIYHLTGQYQKAVAHFEQAAKLSPRRRIPILAYSVYTRYLLRDYAAALET
ncbi:MAG: tetratricopeptide repeat protein, partial [Armatimonadota bacterium]